MSDPLISCLCSSRPQRWGQLQRAILDFSRQTYSNRELVIAVDNADDYASVISAYLRTSVSTHANVRVVRRMMRSQMEGLQQAAIAAEGAILTIWDDDNLNHPERLARQEAYQEGYPERATVLTTGLYFFYQDNEVFPGSWFRPGIPLRDATVPTTLMAYRRAFPPLDPTVRSSPAYQMVDYAAKHDMLQAANTADIAMDTLLHLVGVARSANCPHTRKYEKHRELALKGALPVEVLSQHAEKLTVTLDKYIWPNCPIAVEGQDGGAFSYTPKLIWPDDLYPVHVDRDTTP